MAKRQKTNDAPTSQRMGDAGFTPRTLDAAIAEAAAERGLSGADAELFAMEAWGEYAE